MHSNILGLLFYSLRTRTKEHVLVLRNLGALENLLKNQEYLGMDIAIMLEQTDTLDSIEKYQINTPDEVYQKAVAIIDTYFQEDDGNIDPACPATFNGEMYDF